MNHDRPTIRLGDTAALVARAGGHSAAVRALIILGAAAVGYDLTGVRREIARLGAAELDAAVLDALAALSDRRPTAVGHPAPPIVIDAAPADELEPPLDPFADVGMEV